MTTRNDLLKAYKNKLIDDEKLKDELFKLETSIKLEKKPERDYDSVTEDEFKLMIRHIKSKKILLAMYLAYGSGLRLSEILKLDRDDIKHNIITVRQGKGNIDRKTNTPRGFKREWLTLIPLKSKRISIQKAFYRASIQSKINKVLYEYKTANGQVRKKYRLHFHCLRHSFATRALEKGVPINQVQTLLGHKNLATTSKYVKANPIDAIQSIIDKGV